MQPLVFDLGADAQLVDGVIRALEAERGAMHGRQFPDGEYYLRVDTSPRGRDVVLICSMDRPDRKALNVLFAAATMRDLGARRVGLAAPYLAYMRQDARFCPGEGVTSRYFAAMLSSHVDWLVAVDPHLHRLRTLDQIYSVPALTVRSAACMAAWLRTEVKRPLLIGPDAESRQWVSGVARMLEAPWLVLEKRRSGDRAVSVSAPALEAHRGCTPVLLDDIVSTGRTMIAALEQLTRCGAEAVTCMAVHGLFADDAWQALDGAGAGRIVTSNTVSHDSNAVDVSVPLAEGIGRQLRG